MAPGAAYRAGLPLPESPRQHTGLGIQIGLVNPLIALALLLIGRPGVQVGPLGGGELGLRSGCRLPEPVGCRKVLQLPVLLCQCRFGTGQSLSGSPQGFPLLFQLAPALTQGLRQCLHLL